MAAEILALQSSWCELLYLIHCVVTVYVVIRSVFSLA
jgi:hypothetical protein